MSDDVKHQLKNLLGLSDNFIQGLECGGYVTPATIVDNFGDETKFLCQAFGRIGPHLFQTPDARTLVLFSRAVLGLEFGDIEIESKVMRRLTKTHKYNKEFLSMTKDEFLSILDVIQSSRSAAEADSLLKSIKLKLREWLNRVGPPSVIDT